MPYNAPLTIEELRALCPNDIEPIEDGGRHLIAVLIIQHKGTPKESRLHLRLRLNSFSQLAEEFATSRWGVGNSYAAISTKRPDGQDDRVYVGRGMAYHDQQRAVLAGEQTTPPSTKGMYVAYARDDKLELSSENLPRLNATARRMRTHWATGWTILWRQRMLAEGRAVTTLRPLKGAPALSPEPLGVWKQPEHLEAAIMEVEAFKASLEAVGQRWAAR